MRKKILLISILTICLLIPLTGICQMPYSVSKKDSIQSVIYNQLNDQNVKKDLLKILEKYPILVEENKDLILYQKEIVSGFNTQSKIIDNIVVLGVKEASFRGLILTNNKDPVQILKDFSIALKTAKKREKFWKWLEVGTIVSAFVFSTYKN